MLTFEDFSKRLALGQLKNLSIIDDIDRDKISSEHVQEILELTNQGLIDLSTRFPIITKQIDLVFETNKNSYSLVPAGLATYLDATNTEPFEIDGFIKILDIMDSDGVTHSHDTDGHIITPTYNSVRFTNAKMEELGSRVRIRYQANHVKINENSNIDLPPNLEIALQLFVSALCISHMGGEAHSAKGDRYFASFLRQVGEDELRNTSSTSEVHEDNRLSERGFP